MGDYIKRKDVLKIYENEGAFDYVTPEDIMKIPSADVVEIGVITCFGIKFVVEDDIIKVKWRHGDKHYIVPFGGLLELWEKYQEQNR